MGRIFPRKSEISNFLRPEKRPVFRIGADFFNMINWRYKIFETNHQSKRDKYLDFLTLSIKLDNTFIPELSLRKLPNV